jgi:putative FmdB family regulatory protein
VPTYSYACTECGDRFDAVQAFTDDALTTCTKCAGKLRKLFSSVGVVFKGSGFYRTDSREAAKSASNGSAKSSDNGSEKSTEKAAEKSSASSNAGSGSSEKSSGATEKSSGSSTNSSSSAPAAAASS